MVWEIGQEAPERASPTAPEYFVEPLKMSMYGRPVAKGVEDAKRPSFGIRISSEKLDGKRDELGSHQLIKGALSVSVTTVCTSACQSKKNQSRTTTGAGVDTHLSSLSDAGKASPATLRFQTLSQSTFSSSNNASSLPPKDLSLSPFFRIACHLPTCDSGRPGISLQKGVALSL